MLYKHFILVLFYLFLAIVGSAQNFKFSQPTIIDSQNNWLKQKSNSKQNKKINAKQSMDIFYPKPDSINTSATTGVYWRVHSDFLPQEYVYIRNEDQIQDSINLKFKNAIVNFLWLNDSFNEDSTTFTFTSIAPIKLDSLFFTYAHINRSGMTNYIRTRVVNVDINTGIPILTEMPIWENIITTDTSLTAPNNDPSYLFNDVMVIPVTEEVSFNLPFAVVIDFYGGDKTLDEFYLLCTYNNTCANNNNNTLAQHSKFYPNSFFNISTQFGNQSIEGLFPLSSNGVLGIDVNNDGVVGDSKFCEAFYVQNWHIGATVSFEAALTGSIVANVDTLCNGDTLVLEAMGSLGTQPYTYLWQSSDGTALSTQKQFELMPQNNDTYTLRITDASDNNFLVRKNIVVNTLTIKMPENLSLACDEAFQIEPIINAASENLSYNWINGATKSKITAFPGNYSLTVTDGYCTATDSVNIGIDAELTADFETTIGYGGMVNFNNSSTNATNYFWNFGDENTSTSKNPSHTYQNEGTYVVSLNVLNGKCSINKYKTIIINDFMVGLNEVAVANNMLTVSPNPSTTGIFWVSTNFKENNKTINYTIFDVSGKILFNEQLVNQQNKFKLNLAELPNSTYFIKIYDEHNVIIKKLLLIQ